MNQPTEDRIKKLEEEVRQLREQITEPIRIDHLEIARSGTQDLLRETNKKLEQIIQAQDDRGGKLETLELGQQELKQELNTYASAWLNTLQEHYTEHKQDISGVTTILNGHAKYFEEHGKRLSHIEASMATKDDIANTVTRQDFAAFEARMTNLIRQLLDPNTKD